MRGGHVVGCRVAKVLNLFEPQLFGVHLHKQKVVTFWNNWVSMQLSQRTASSIKSHNFCTFLHGTIQNRKKLTRNSAW